MSTLTGQCLCGGVQFETPQPRYLDVCHCGMCQKSGGPFVTADFRAGITLTKRDSLKWYESSKWAKRGFCGTCGTRLFYRLKADENFWAVAAGTLNIPEGQSLHKEIFIDSKPDYYNFSGNHMRQTGAEVIAEHTASKKDD